MADPPGYTTRLQGLVDRWAEGDATAIDENIAHSQDRLGRMAHRMLAEKAHVGRWSQTNDVLSTASITASQTMKVRPMNEDQIANALRANRVIALPALIPHGPLGLEQLAEAFVLVCPSADCLRVLPPVNGLKDVALKIVKTPVDELRIGITAVRKRRPVAGILLGSRR
ncbi:MAG TPA: hypothetical protein VFI31_15145 [Pirellulales bacterium]|nr:hypothetical protein [Pirellulales bacterium]